jgi:hypothetical protein
MSEDTATITVGFDWAPGAPAETPDGRDAHLADGVQRALGREPRASRDVARGAAAGPWSRG